MKSLEDNPNKNIPSISSIIILIKPITWFPPMWAFLCGAVSSSNISLDTSMLLFIGLILSGPIVCGMSQAINDWCDKEVDAINEPSRPIPSGKVPGSWGVWIAVIMSITGIIISWFLGFWGFFCYFPCNSLCLGVLSRTNKIKTLWNHWPKYCGALLRRVTMVYWSSHFNFPISINNYNFSSWILRIWSIWYYGFKWL